MTGRTIAIGDIHGCVAALASLIDAINPTADDTIVVLGDFIDRGPDSRGVIDLMLDLVDRCEVIPLLGNHEQILLDAFDSNEVLRVWQSVGGNETLESYGGSLQKIPMEHIVFFRGLQRHYETDSHLFVHANYDPQLSLEQQPDTLLLWEHIAHTLPTRHASGKTAIVGHTPQASGEVLDMGYLICIDTYCIGGGWLTALDVDNRNVWQSDRDGNLRAR